MTFIKPYEEKYKKDVQQVCINTGPNAAATDIKVREYLLSAYNDYYTECEGQHCFVLVDENDVAQGYILCAADYQKFKKAFSPYLKKIRKCGFAHYIEILGELSLLKIFSQKYPAHLHIDLNSGFRGNGNGSKMISLLTEKLKKENINGLMLIVGSGNKEGIRFYDKNGFRKIFSICGGTVMAKEL